LLLALSWVYRAAIACDRMWGWRTARPVPSLDGRRVPTLVVGNWVVGGAGKTPATLAILAHLQASGWTPGVISRGYGRRGRDGAWVDPHGSEASEVGDEPILIARRAGVPVVVGRDRHLARTLLLQQAPEVDIVVADDGLQHHRLWRDLEVVVVDERGAGNGQCLPAGPLREPLPQRLHDRTLVLYSAGVATLSLPGHRAQRQLSGVQRLEDWSQGQPLAPGGGWGELHHRSLHAAAGIAVPERFFAALRAQGLDLRATHALPDHDPWLQVPWPAGTTDVVVTEKDAVKLLRQGARLSPTRVWVARLDLCLPPDFKHSLDQRLGRPSPTAPGAA